MATNAHNRGIKEIVLQRKFVSEQMFIQVSVLSKKTGKATIVDFILVWWGQLRVYIAKPIIFCEQAFYYVESISLSPENVTYIKRILLEDFGIEHVTSLEKPDNEALINRLMGLITP